MITLFGIILGLTAIIMGAVLEHLSINALIQYTAAFIVFGGTLGAVLVSVTTEEFIRAIKMTPRAFIKKKHDHATLINKILELANVARKEGIISLDSRLKDIEYPFMQHFLRQIVDGYEPEVLKEMMEDRILTSEEEGIAASKVYMDAGGFAPTIGILGAVLGLINVMSNLQDSSKLGAGIAVAFVATVYGVGSANLIFIPLANKLKKIVRDDITTLRIQHVGLIGIQNGLNPRVIEDQLYNILGEFKSHERKKEDAGDAQKAAA